MSSFGQALSSATAEVADDSFPPARQLNVSGPLPLATGVEGDSLLGIGVIGTDGGDWPRAQQLVPFSDVSVMIALQSVSPVPSLAVTKSSSATILSDGKDNMALAEVVVDELTDDRSFVVTASTAYTSTAEKPERPPQYSLLR